MWSRKERAWHPSRDHSQFFLPRLSTVQQMIVWCFSALPLRFYRYKMQDTQLYDYTMADKHSRFYFALTSLINLFIATDVQDDWIFFYRLRTLANSHQHSSLSLQKKKMKETAKCMSLFMSHIFSPSVVLTGFIWSDWCFRQNSLKSVFSNLL